jgi:hypothetical protein
VSGRQLVISGCRGRRTDSVRKRIGERDIADVAVCTFDHWAAYLANDFRLLRV